MSYPPSPYKVEHPHSAPQVRRHGIRLRLQVLLGVVVFVVSEIIATLPVVIPVVVDAARKALESNGVVSGTFNIGAPTTAGEAWLWLVGMVCGSAVSVLGYLWVVGKIGKFPGDGMKGRRKSVEFLMGAAVGFGLMALSVVGIWLLGGYQVHGLNPLPVAATTLVFALAMGIGAGFMEEILFRGFLLRVFDAWWGWLPALAVTSVLFGLVHITNPEATVFGAVAIMFEAGILLGAAFLLTRRLWLAIGIHTGWNFTQAGIFSSDVSGTGDQRGLINATWQGSDWITGGSMGMEGSVVTVVVATVAGLAMLGLAHKHGLLRPSVKKEQRLAEGGAAEDAKP